MFTVRTLGVLISSIGFGFAVGSGLATVGARCVGVEGRVVANVLEDAVQESGKGGDLAGSQESKGVGLDGGGPVGRMGVQGVEERFLDFGDMPVTQQDCVDLRSQVRIQRGRGIVCGA